MGTKICKCGKYIDYLSAHCRSCARKEVWNKKRALMIESLTGVKKSVPPWNKGVAMTNKVKAKVSSSCTSAWDNLEYHAKMCIIRKKQMTEEIRTKIAKKLKSRDITSLEKIVKSIIEEYSLPFKFVGSGELIIHGLCPDFIDNANTKIIEVYYEYFKVKQYGSEEAYRRKRFAIFRHYGYDTLFINWKDLSTLSRKEIADKINDFYTNNSNNE